MVPSISIDPAASAAAVAVAKAGAIAAANGSDHCSAAIDRSSAVTVGIISAPRQAADKFKQSQKRRLQRVLISLLNVLSRF